MRGYRYWGMISLLSAGLALTLAGCGGGSGGGGGTPAVGSDNSYNKTNVAVSTLAGTGYPGCDDGNGLKEATFRGPYGLALGKLGNTTYLFVADTGSKAIRSIDLSNSTSVVTTLVKNGATVSGVTVNLSAPKGIICDSSNNLYVSDSSNIYKINSAVTSFTTLVSSGLSNATGFFKYNDTTFYVADYGYHIISSVTSTGTVAKIAGISGAPGVANTALGQFRNPYCITSDGNGNLYVTDSGNNTIRKIVISTGNITTLAGLATKSGLADGAGTIARFNNPTGITFYNGSLYVADTGNHIIRRVVIPLTEDPDNPNSETAVVSTIAGYKGVYGSSDSTTYGNDAKFYSPTGILSDNNGKLYVADRDNNRIRVIDISKL